jgi:hypothetical protein
MFYLRDLLAKNINAIKNCSFFFVLTACCLLGKTQYFGGISCIHLHRNGDLRDLSEGIRKLRQKLTMECVVKQPFQGDELNFLVPNKTRNSEKGLLFEACVFVIGDNWEVMALFGAPFDGKRSELLLSTRVGKFYFRRKQLFISGKKLLLPFLQAVGKKLPSQN